MPEEKTLLQQIREKEQEFAGKIEAVRKETEAAVAAAENDAESLLCTADSTGRSGAERLYWEEKGKIEAEIERLNHEAEEERRQIAAAAETNLSHAIKVITSHVTME